MDLTAEPETQAGHGHGSPADRLYRHALESIFAFLPLAGLHSMLAVSLKWQQAVGTMRPLGVPVSKLSSTPFRVCVSRLGRHVNALVNASSEVVNNILLFLLKSRLAHLRSLQCCLGPMRVGPIVFPSEQLVQLELILLKSFAAPAFNRVLAALRPCHQLASLKLRLASHNPTASFVALAPKRMPALRTLVVDLKARTDVGVPWTDAQLDSMRALTQLETLLIDGLGPLLSKLLRAPHQLAWQVLNGANGPIGGAQIHHFASLSSLTKLHTWTEGPGADVDFLASLPLLRTLSVSVHPDGLALPLMAGLRSCVRVTDLSLMNGAFSSALLTDLVAHMPELAALGIGQQIELDSLQFLASGTDSESESESDAMHMARCLTSLSLETCIALPLVELRHLHGLRTLRHLTLHGSFTEPLDSYSQAQFTPPSELLPALVAFNYEPPVVVEIAQIDA